MTMKVLVYPGRFLTACTVAVAVFTTTVVLPVRSDVLELKDGTVLNGLYMGGSQSSMRFRVKDDIQVIPIEKILALTVTGRSTASAGSTLAPPPPAKATELPVGTRLLVKLMESIDTRKNKAGSRFTAKLEGKLMVDGQEMVAAGSKVYGQIVTAKRGGIGKKKPVLELKLIEISINGELRPIKTNLLSGTGEGGGAGGKVLKGAAIGGLASGSSGAEDGAKIGLAVAILG
ncbi:MAG: hypothetical protein O7D36_10190, partial [Gammaproteobacteria bacterium]|nr:hypothetical protein [Gammaproteobacteria bacterium]